MGWTSGRSSPLRPSGARSSLSTDQPRCTSAASRVDFPATEPAGQRHRTTVSAPHRGVQDGEAALVEQRRQWSRAREAGHGVVTGAGLGQIVDERPPAARNVATPGTSSRKRCGAADHSTPDAGLTRQHGRNLADLDDDVVQPSGEHRHAPRLCAIGIRDADDPVAAELLEERDHVALDHARRGLELFAQPPTRPAIRRGLSISSQTRRPISSSAT